MSKKQRLLIEEKKILEFMDQQPAQTTPSENTNAPVTPLVTQPVDNQSIQPPTSSPPPNPQHKKGSLPLVILFIIISFLCGLALATWYFQNQLQELKKANQETTAAEIKTELIIGTDPTAPPMESLNPGGNLIGYDIDLGYRIADEIGMKAKFAPIAWDVLFQHLEDKKVDMIISSVTITDERKKKYAFSEPYINAGQVIVSRKDNPITSVEKLRGRKISAQKGTTNEQEAYKYTDKDLVLSYDAFEETGNAVSVASAEALLSDLTLAKGLLEKYDNLAITSDPFTNEYYGIVIRKDDKELQKKVNEAIAILQVNGLLTDLKQKWLE
jgi:polar amino acid transport system substrate-binding protein